MHNKAYIDLLTDGQSGAGGFFRIFKEDGTSNYDINCEAEEDAITELDDIEPYIALVKSTAKKFKIFLVRDGNTRDEPFTLAEWEKMFRKEMSQYA